MIEKIKELSKKYSNDSDFGSEVRKILNKIEPEEASSMYGTRMSQTCHKGYECGLSGLGCKNPSCPHT
jgi:hypothetical protein